MSWRCGVEEYFLVGCSLIRAVSPGCFSDYVGKAEVSGGQGGVGREAESGRGSNSSSCLLSFLLRVLGVNENKPGYVG